MEKNSFSKLTINVHKDKAIQRDKTMLIPTIDRQFEAMATDASYHRLNESITDEFAESDWEALQLEKDSMSESKDGIQAA